MNNLEIYRGDTQIYELNFTDENGDAIDITDWVVWFTVKSDQNALDDDADIQVIVDTHSDPTNGKTVVELSNDDTDLEIGSYYYDIQTKDSDDKIKTIVAGKFIVSRDITLNITNA
jgi:hypothetical protein